MVPSPIPGVQGGFGDKFATGAAFGKSLTFEMGQTNRHSYLEPPLDCIKDGQIDPSPVIAHRFGIDRTPEA